MTEKGERNAGGRNPRAGRSGRGARRAGSSAPLKRIYLTNAVRTSRGNGPGWLELPVPEA